MAHEWFAAPILADVGEQTMLNTVPFAGAGGQMIDRHLQSCVVGETLQLALPKADTSAVAAAAVGGDDQALGVGITGLTEPLPPSTDALDCKFRRISIDTDINPALVGSEVVDPIGRHFALSLNFEIVDEHRLGSPLGRNSLPPFLKSPTSCVFLASTEIAGSPAASAAFTVV